MAYQLNLKQNAKQIGCTDIGRDDIATQHRQSLHHLRYFSVAVSTVSAISAVDRTETGRFLFEQCRIDAGQIVKAWHTLTPLHRRR